MGFEPLAEPADRLGVAVRHGQFGFEAQPQRLPGAVQVGLRCEALPDAAGPADVAAPQRGDPREQVGVPDAEGRTPLVGQRLGGFAARELELPAQVVHQVAVGAVAFGEVAGVLDVGGGLVVAALDHVHDGPVDVGAAVPALGVAALGEGAELAELRPVGRVALFEEHDPAERGGEQAHLHVAGAAGDRRQLLDDGLALGGGAGAPVGGVGGPEPERDVLVGAGPAGGDHVLEEQPVGEVVVVGAGFGGLPREAFEGGGFEAGELVEALVLRNLHGGAGEQHRVAGVFGLAEGQVVEAAGLVFAAEPPHGPGQVEAEQDPSADHLGGAALDGTAVVLLGAADAEAAVRVGSGAGQELDGGLGVEVVAGEPGVVGDLGGEHELLERLVGDEGADDASVVVGGFGGAHGVVERLAHEVVDEDVAVLLAAHEPGLACGVEGALDLVEVQPRGLGHDGGVELAAADRGEGEHPDQRRGQLVDAAPEGVAHPGGGRVDGLAGSPQARGLLDEERVAARAAGDLGDRGRVGGVADGGADEGGDTVLVEPFETDHRGLGDEREHAGPQSVAGVDLGVAVGADEQEPLEERVPAGELEQFEAAGVGEVEVVEHDQERAALGDGDEQLGDGVVELELDGRGAFAFAEEGEGGGGRAQGAPGPLRRVGRAGSAGPAIHSQCSGTASDSQEVAKAMARSLRRAAATSVTRAVLPMPASPVIEDEPAVAGDGAFDGRPQHCGGVVAADQERVSHPTSVAEGCDTCHRVPGGGAAAGPESDCRHSDDVPHVSA